MPGEGATIPVPRADAASIAGLGVSILAQARQDFNTEVTA